VFLPLKTLMGRKNSFQKPTQFSQGNNEIDAPASNKDGFLSKDKCVSATQLNRCIWNKMSLSPIKPSNN
jgi:hypothetical protein